MSSEPQQQQQRRQAEARDKEKQDCLEKERLELKDKVFFYKTIFDFKSKFYDIADVVIPVFILHFF